MLVPVYFEYIETNYSFNPPVETRKYVVVLETFVHHYSGELMRRVRVDYLDPWFGRAYSEFMTLREDELERMLKTRVTED